MKANQMNSFQKFAGTLLVTVLIQAFGATPLTPSAFAQESGKEHRETMRALRQEKREKSAQISELKVELAEAKKKLAEQKASDAASAATDSTACDACATACPVPADLKEETPKALCLKFDAMKEDILKALVERAARDGKAGGDRAACDTAVSGCTAVIKKRNLATLEAKVKSLETDIAALSSEKADIKEDIKITRLTKGCASCREALYERRELSSDFESDLGPIAGFGGSSYYGSGRGNGAAAIISASTPLLLGGAGMYMYGRQVNAWENASGNYYQACFAQGVPCNAPGGVPLAGGFGPGFGGGLFGGFGGFGVPFGGGLNAGIGLNLGLGLGTGFGNVFGNGFGSPFGFGLGTGLGTGLYGMNPFGGFGGFGSPFGGGLNAGIGLNLGLGLGNGFGNGFGIPFGGGFNPFGNGFGLNGGLGLGLGLGNGFDPFGNGLGFGMNGGGFPNQMYLMQLQQQQQMAYQLQLQQQQQAMYQAAIQQQAMIQYQVRSQQLAQAVMISQQQVAQAYSRYTQVAQMYQANQFQAQAFMPNFGGAGFGLSAGLNFNLGLGGGLNPGFNHFGGARSVEELIRMQGGSGLPTSLPSYSEQYNGLAI